MITEIKGMNLTHISINDDGGMGIGFKYSRKEVYLSGQPCRGNKCYAHVKTPCEYCGRIGMQGKVVIERL